MTARARRRFAVQRQLVARRKLTVGRFLAPWRLLALVAGLSAAGAAHAGEDAGTQSVFGTGSGARALGMGSAFVATADDASALFWNPAGLAGARRLELQALQWSDGLLGFRETNASFVLPDWRWGAVGGAMRVFGTDGIEQRDAGNQILPGTTGDSQMETAFGYARSFGEAWDLGGSVKIVRHSLAGFSASGLGADVGVRVRPSRLFGAAGGRMDGVTWGLALRNAMEPSLRLDRESVRDPSSLRGGMAWTMPASGLGRFTGEVDLEKPKQVNARVRAGLEWLPLPGIAMRAGLRAAGISAGAGFAWNACGLDYAFEDNPLGAQHRVGVTWKLGTTTEARRQAAMTAEDARTQQQMAEAYTRLHEAQVAELVRRVEGERAEGRIDAALETVGWLATVAPEHPERIRLELACLLEKAGRLEQEGDYAGAGVIFERGLTVDRNDSTAAAGVPRCLEMSRLRAARSSERQNLYALALSAFAAEKLPEARGRLRELLAIEPGDADGRLLLDRTEQAIRSRISRGLEQAQRFVDADMHDEAARTLEEVRTLDPSAPGLAALQDALHRQSTAAGRSSPALAASSAAVSPGVPARSSLSAAEAAALYERGLEALRAQRSEEAVRYLELVWSARPAFREAGAILKREHLARGLGLFAAGRLEEAIAQWNRALRIDPNDPRIRGYLERGQKELARSREILGTRTTP